MSNTSMSHTNPATTEAIAEFLSRGGKIVKLPETIPVTGPDVVDYLQSSGFSARFVTNNTTTVYMYNGKPVGLKKLIEVANRHRLAQQLPPFAARV
jgi:hypothetical protein